MFQNLLKKTKKILVLSLSSIVVVSLLAFVYSLMRDGNFLRNVFDFNYFIASIVILYGLFTFLVPINLKKSNRLVDHSNYAEVHREEKEDRISNAFESIFWGVATIVIIGVIELLLGGII